MPARATPLARLRAVALALPQAYEQETWELPTFRVGQRIFAMYVPREGRPALWVKAPPGAQAILVGADAERFFAPPYLGPKGWVGMHLDRGADWTEVAGLVRRSFSLVVPRRLAALLGQAQEPLLQPGAEARPVRARRAAPAGPDSSPSCGPAEPTVRNRPPRPRHARRGRG